MLANPVVSVNVTTKVVTEVPARDNVGQPNFMGNVTTKIVIEVPARYNVGKPYFMS